MKYSIIWLNYDPEDKKPFTTESLLSLKKSSAGFDHEIIPVMDVVGYSNAVNDGLHQATGDYLVICSDDVFIDDPQWLTKITAPNAIVSWRFVPFYMTKENVPDGSVYGFSREVYELIGDMDTRYVGGYGCDEVDHFFTAKEKGVNFIKSDMNVRHLENATFKTYHKENKEEMTTRNISLFYEKWKNKYQLNP